MPERTGTGVHTGVAVTLHGLCGPPGSELDAWLRAGDHRVPGTESVLSPFRTVLAEVSGPAELLADCGDGLERLVEGAPATVEAVGVRARRRGADLSWGTPAREVDTNQWARLCYDRGRDSVCVLRADPSLVNELQIGDWWAASPLYRLLRRLPGSPLSWPRAVVDQLSPRVLGDLCFWAGVRAAATPREWRRLAHSSYVVLCYHRLAGEMKSGQQRMDLPPRVFRRQLRLLRVFGWRELAPEEMVRFHTDPDAVLDRRRYVLTVDDAFRDAVAALRTVTGRAPQVFAVTGSVGGGGEWLDGEPLADWTELDELRRRGGLVGSHARHHVRLSTLSDDEVDAEVTGSLADLRRHLPVDLPLLAYPHGAHDVRVRSAAVEAGYLAAYSSLHGRNGAGTDMFSLRRVEPKAHESTAVFVWKVLTGSNRPPAYRRLLRDPRARLASILRSESPGRSRAITAEKR